MYHLECNRKIDYDKNHQVYKCECGEEAEHPVLCEGEGGRNIESVTFPIKTRRDQPLSSPSLRIPYIQIKYKKLSPDAQMPTYAHHGDAGMDLYASKPATLWCYHKSIVHTDIAVQIPGGYFGLIRPRSGLAVKNGITAISSGVIDAGYRGEIRVLLQNHGHTRYDIAVGDRIAQLLILPVLHAILEETDELSPSARGEQGHGSTGK